jgi:hypothetical protein
MATDTRAPVKVNFDLVLWPGCLSTVPWSRTLAYF